MANPEHLAVLKQGLDEWSRWRENHRDTDASVADLSGANLSGVDLSRFDLSVADLSGTDLSGGNLSRANLTGADLSRADLLNAKLSRANLEGANLSKAGLISANLARVNLFRADLSEASLAVADLMEADLSECNLSKADLRGTNLSRANLRGADLTGADLSGAFLVETNLDLCQLSGTRVYGVSAWNVSLDGARQSGLLITASDEPDVTVDNIEVAQFVYLLLKNRNVRNLIDTITSKVVLILGRFTPERKSVLESLRTALRAKGYSPVLFDFEKPASRDLTETISTLAGMARFVIADITDAKSIPQELQAIVPNYPSVPVQPVLLRSEHEYAMFERFRRFPWVLPVVLYDTREQLLEKLEGEVIGPAEAMAVAQRPSVPATPP